MLQVVIITVTWQIATPTALQGEEEEVQIKQPK